MATWDDINAARARIAVERDALERSIKKIDVVLGEIRAVYAINQETDMAILRLREARFWVKERIAALKGQS